MIGIIEVDAIDRMIAGEQKRVEIWEGMDPDNAPAKASGLAFHKGQLKALKLVRDMIK